MPCCGSVWFHTAWSFLLMDLPTESIISSHFLSYDNYGKHITNRQFQVCIDSLTFAFNWRSATYPRHWNRTWFEDAVQFCSVVDCCRRLPSLLEIIFLIWSDPIRLLITIPYWSTFYHVYILWRKNKLLYFTFMNINYNKISWNLICFTSRQKKLKCCDASVNFNIRYRWLSAKQCRFL